MSIPGVNFGNRARVFKRVAEQLHADPVLEAVVKTWTTGIPSIDGRRPPMTASTATHVRLTPALGAVTWYSPDSHIGNLQIKVEILLAGAATGDLDMLDVINLWEAIENAFYPVGDRPRQLKVERELREAGSHTGQVWFSQPANFAGTDPDTGAVVATGMMQLDVIRTYGGEC